MSLTQGLQLPFGIQPVNSVPVDSWSGPYEAVSLQDAIDLANIAIPIEIRFQSMEVRLIVGGVSKKFWYRDGITDTDLIEFGLGPIGVTGATGPTGATGFGVTASFYLQGTTDYVYNTTSNIYRTGSLNIGSGTVSNGRFVVSGTDYTSGFGILSGTVSLVVDNNGSVYNLSKGIDNIAYGFNALKSAVWWDGSALGNVSIGHYSLQNNTIGRDNIAVGNSALISNISGQGNVAIGRGNLSSNISGGFNISIGSDNLTSNTTGNSNISIGYTTLSENAATASGNVAIGNGAGMRTSTSYNVAIGYQSSQYNLQGSRNTSVGYQASFYHQTGNQNTSLGYSALSGFFEESGVITGSSYNTGIGYQSLGALIKNTTYNTAIGYNSGLYIGTTTSYATASNWSTYIGANTRSYSYNSVNEVVIGASAVGNGSYSVTIGNDSITKTILKGNVGIGVTGPNERLVVASSTGTMSLIVTDEGYVYNKDRNGIVSNLAFGLSASARNTTGNNNTVFGNYSLYTNTNKSFNVAIGAYTLFNNNADYNIGIGAAVLSTNTTGTQNTGIGAYSMYYNIDGSFNTAIGVGSLQNGTQSSRNTGIGGYSLYNTKGNRNIGIGFFGGSAITTGNDNTVIGSDPNNNYEGLTTGSNNTIIGKVVTGITVGDNNTIMGRVSGLSAGLTNSVILADGSGNIRFYSDSNGNVGIGLTGPSTKLHVYATQSGAFRLQDGTQANGYVLISDANGVGSWTASSPTSYKVYTALLSQSGTSAPTAIVLENTLGTITFSYVGIGYYNINSSGLFTNNKTFILLGGSQTNHNNLDFDPNVAYDTILTNQILFHTGLNNDPQSVMNGLMENTTIEIRVYN